MPEILSFIYLIFNEAWIIISYVKNSMVESILNAVENVGSNK